MTPEREIAMTEKSQTDPRTDCPARRAGLYEGAYVNLGWGIPNLIADYLPKGLYGLFPQRKWNPRHGPPR